MSIDSISATSHSLPGAPSGKYLHQSGQCTPCRHVERHRSSLRSGFHPYDAKLRHAWVTKGSAITAAVRMAPENVPPPASAATVMVMLEQDEPTELPACLSADGKTGEARLRNGDTIRISAIRSNAGATVYGVRGEWRNVGMPDGSHRLLRGVVHEDRFTPHAYQPDLTTIVKRIPAWGLAGGAQGSVFDAIESNDLDALKRILRDPTPLNDANDEGHPALHVAVLKGATDVVKLLLASKRIDPGMAVAGTIGLLQLAIQNTHFEVAAMLMACERIVFTAEDGAGLPVIAARCDARALRLVLDNVAYAPYITQAHYVAALHAVMTNPRDGIVTVEMVRLLRRRCKVADIDQNDRSTLRDKIYQHFDDPDHIVALEDALPRLLHEGVASATPPRKPRTKLSFTSLRRTQDDPQKTFDSFIANPKKALSADKLDTLQTWLGYGARADISQWIVFDHTKNSSHVAADRQAVALAVFVVALPHSARDAGFNGLTLLGLVLKQMGKIEVHHRGLAVSVLASQLHTMPPQLQLHTIEHCLTVPVLLALRSCDFAEVFNTLQAQLKNTSLDSAIINALQTLLDDTSLVERANSIHAAGPYGKEVLQISERFGVLCVELEERFPRTTPAERQVVEYLQTAIQGAIDTNEMHARKIGLTALPLGMSELTALTRCDLRDNDLRELPADFPGWPATWEIDLRGNKQLSVTAHRMIAKALENGSHIEYDRPGSAANRAKKNAEKNTAPNPMLLGAELAVQKSSHSRSSSENSMSIGGHSRAASIVTNLTYSNIVTQDDLVQQAIASQMGHIASHYSQIPHLETYFKAVKEIAGAKVAFLAGSHPGISGSPTVNVPIGPKALGGAAARAPFVGAAANSAIGSIYQRLSNKRILKQRNVVPLQDRGKFSETLARILTKLTIERPKRLQANGSMQKAVSKLEFFSARVQGTTCTTTAAERFAQMVGEGDVERIFKYMAQRTSPDLTLTSRLALAVNRLYQREGVIVLWNVLNATIQDTWGESGQRSTGPLSEEPLMQTVTRDVKSNQAAIRANTQVSDSHEQAIATLTAELAAMRGEIRLLHELVGDDLPKVGARNAEGRTRAGNLYRRATRQDGIVSGTRQRNEGYAILPLAAQEGRPILAYTLPEQGAGIYHQAAQGRLAGVAMANMLAMRYSDNTSSLLITEAGFGDFVKRLAATETFDDDSSRSASVERRTRKMALADLEQYFTQHADKGFPQIELHHGHFIPGPRPLRFVPCAADNAPDDESRDDLDDLDDLEEIGLDCVFRNAGEMVMIALDNGRFHAYRPEKATPLELKGSTMSDALIDFLGRHSSDYPDGLAFSIVSLKLSDPSQQGR